MMHGIGPRGWLAAACLACVTLVGCPPSLSGPQLSLNPIVLYFGTDGVEESFTIGNTGSGVLTWTVSESLDWLSVDVAAGSTTTELDRITLTADRSGLAPGASYNGVITIDSNAGTRTVAVAITSPGTPVLEVSPQNVSLVGTATTTQFTIRNTGDGPLGWGIVLQDSVNPGSGIALPSYLTITPNAGLTSAGGETVVTVELDRTGLPEGVQNLTLLVQSSAGTVPVGLSIGVGTSSEIGVDPIVLDFGTTATQQTFDVFNTGPNGSNLTFTLSTDRPDLIFLSPLTGQSIGTSATDKDKVPITVTIDRTALTGATDGGLITISSPGLTPVNVTVAVTAAPLTIEGATNRARPPFIERFVFLMRDSAGRAIDSTDPAIFQELQTAFTIEEDEVLLDPAETNQFVTSAQNLKYDIVLLLDFTGSMYNAGTGGGSAIQTMVAAAKEFITDLPSSYRIAVMEYHERQQTNRLIHGFSTQKQPLLDALDAFSLPVGDHGASEVFDAVADACTRLGNEGFGVLPFDDADVRAVVYITDGRDTSSVTTLQELNTLAKDNRVRLYPVGFGTTVNSADLITLATDTGGHYYAAPDTATLVSLLENETGMGAAAPGLIATELSRQIVLTYVSLFQDGSHRYLITADYQGVQGSFERDGILAYGGDVRAGQLGLYTTGLLSGTAEVYLRAEYIPRNVSQFRVRFITAQPYSLELAPNGLLAGWTLVPEGGGVYTVLTTDTNFLQYGSFGDLLKLTFTGVVPASFDLGFRADNRVYLNPPTTKFFQYPDTLTVADGSSSATVVPIALAAGFNPDAPDAWDRDGDTVPDFDDLFPDDPLLSKSIFSPNPAGSLSMVKE